GPGEEHVTAREHGLHVGVAQPAEYLGEGLRLYSHAAGIDATEERNAEADGTHDACAAARWRIAGVMTRCSHAMAKRGSKRREHTPQEVWFLGLRYRYRV